MRIESTTGRDAPDRSPNVRRVTSVDRTRAPASISFPGALLHAAAGWFLIGCLGLVWAVVYDVGTSTLQLALAAWATLFLLPATIAAIIAYRMDEAASPPPGARSRRAQAARLRRAGQH
jgi:hypothetical protein